MNTKMKIKKGDSVIVRTGKDQGKKGKVLRVLPAENRVVVEGINMKKKRQRARKSNEKGQMIEMPFPVSAANVMLFCSSCNAGRRAASKMEKNKKVRVCVKCAKEL